MDRQQLIAALREIRDLIRSRKSRLRKPAREKADHAIELCEWAIIKTAQPAIDDALIARRLREIMLLVHGAGIAEIEDDIYVED